MEEEAKAAADAANESSGVMDPETYQRVFDWLIANGLTLIVAILIFVVGKWKRGYIPFV